MQQLNSILLQNLCTLNDNGASGICGKDANVRSAIFTLFTFKCLILEIENGAIDPAVSCQKKPSALKKACTKISDQLASAYRRVLVYLNRKNRHCCPEELAIPVYTSPDPKPPKQGACFGVSVETRMDPYGENVYPLFLRDACKSLTSQKSAKKLKNAMNGSADPQLVQKIIDVYDSGNPTESARKIVLEGDIAAVGAALMHYLARLPSSLCHKDKFFNAQDQFEFFYECTCSVNETYLNAEI
jgi:hypothetical protein